MHAITINLPENLKAFVTSQIAEGGYDDASAYITALIADLQKRKARERVEALLREGIESGPSAEMTSDEWETLRRETLAELNAQKSS
jgi:antitoxin ParD1/3/4